MACSMTHVMTRARARHNCASAVSPRASFIVSISSRPRTRAAALGRLLTLTRARSRHMVVAVEVAVGYATRPRVAHVT